MHLFLYPEATTFINSQNSLSNRNFGKDEVVEIEKIILNSFNGLIGSGSNLSSSISLSRTLIKFDFSEVSKSISDGTITNPTFSLTLKSTETKRIEESFAIEAYPISSSWKNGTGKKYDEVIQNNGVTWKSRYTGLLWNNAGADYITNTSASFNFNLESSDIKLNVTEIVNKFLKSEIQNNGIILKLADETSSISYGRCRYFSQNTNTIYYPYLDISWQDSTYNTGSLSVIKDLRQENVVYIKNIKPEYRKSEIVQFDVGIRKKYIDNTFQKWPNQTYPVNNYQKYYALPQKSYYSIVDYLTDEVWVDFSETTKISCDSSGSYFSLDMSGFPLERDYKILIKVTENNTSNIYDIGDSFRITR